MGRSSAPGSLQIFTQGMKDIQLVDDFVPKGAPRGNGEGHAVTIAAGVNLAELYAAVARHNRTVLGGSSKTVGTAGGYIHGGGHSPFSTWKGLASDNALEFEVVTADVSAPSIYRPNHAERDTGSTCNRAPWSQQTHTKTRTSSGPFERGGGTFGVTTSVTIRSFPDVPVVVSNLNITTINSDPHFWDAFTQFHAALPALNEAGGSGYYAAIPNLSLNKTSVAAFTATLFFPETTDTAAIDRLYGPLLKKLRQIPNVQTQCASFAMPSMNKVISQVLLGRIAAKFDTTGTNSIIGSRLISKDLLVSKDGPERLTNAWKCIKTPPSSQIIGLVVGDGAVASNADKIDSAVHPAWRKAVTQMGFTRGWDANASFTEQHAIIGNMTDVEIPILRGVEGEENMGAYVNEASPYEPGFQKSFWGENYQKLYAIKKKWDPKGLFITRLGVGSEDRDDTGVCLRDQ